MYLSVIAGFCSALFNSITIYQTKKLTSKYNPRSLVGPLFLANLLITTPLVYFESWTFSPKIVFLHILGAFIGSIATLMALDLYEFGEASAIATAEALSPFGAFLGTIILLPTLAEKTPVIPVLLIGFGVIFLIGSSFENNFKYLFFKIGSLAIAEGLFTVIARLLANEHVGIIQNYFFRVLIIAIFFSTSFSKNIQTNIVLWKNDGLLILGRALTNTIHFLFVIYGSSYGLPVVTQTISSTAPIFLHLHFYISTKNAPSWRAIFAVLVITSSIYFLIS